jgi:hypothetical protein
MATLQAITMLMLLALKGREWHAAEWIGWQDENCNPYYDYCLFDEKSSIYLIVCAVV